MNVSVIIAAYNAASTLAESIESVMAQTSPDWETIVVDDGSTDATAAIAHSFAERDARIRVVSQPNGGESAARNTGIDQARHDWLLFLDADDWIAPTHLARLTAELAANPDLDAVHCGSVRVTIDGTRIADDFEPPAGDLFPTLARRSAFPVHACIVRRCLVKAVGKLDTSLKKCPDWDLWQRIARSGARFGAVREVLAYYRITPNSSSLDAEQLLRDGLTVLRRGHAADPRVQNPQPNYAGGLAGDKIDDQAFYLLAWNAGLLLGAAKHATVLLEQVRDLHSGGLYADAIAKCIFEAGSLPSSQPREAWEGLFPGIARAVEEFLAALEAQSQTPGLAAAALHELKRLILKHSPLWKSVIEQQERASEQQQAFVEWLSSSRDSQERLRSLVEQLQSEKAAAGRELEAAQRQIAALTAEQAAQAQQMTRENDALAQEKAALEGRLEEARQEHAVLVQDKAALEIRLDEARREHAAALEQQKDILAQERAAFEARLDETRREHAAALEQQKDILAQERAAFEARLDETRREHAAALEQQKDIQAQEIAASETRLDEARREHAAALEQQKGVLAQETAAFEDRLDEARREHTAALEQQKDILAQERTAFEDRLDETRREHAAALEQQKGVLAQERAAFEGRLDQARREHAAALIQEKAVFEIRLNEAHGEHAATLAQQKTAFEDRLYEASRMHAAALAQQRAALEARLDEARREYAATLEQEKAWFETGLDQARREQAMLDEQKALLETDLDQARREQAELAWEIAVFEESLEQSRAEADALAVQKSTAEEELSRWRGLADERERVLARLRAKPWIHLGSRIQLLKAADLRAAAIERAGDVRSTGGDPAAGAPPSGGFTDAPPENGQWQLRVGQGAAAKLAIANGYPDTFRVDISKAASQSTWDVQLNHGGLAVQANHRYALHFRARADQPRSIGVGLAKGGEPWTNIGFYKEFHLTPEWRAFREEFTVAENEPAARVHLDVGRRKVAVEVSGLRLEDLERK